MHLLADELRFLSGFSKQRYLDPRKPLRPQPHWPSTILYAGGKDGRRPQRCRSIPAGPLITSSQGARPPRARPIRSAPFPSSPEWHLNFHGTAGGECVSCELRKLRQDPEPGQDFIALKILLHRLCRRSTAHRTTCEKNG